MENLDEVTQTLKWLLKIGFWSNKVLEITIRRSRELSMAFNHLKDYL